MSQTALGPADRAVSHRHAIQSLAERWHSPLDEVERLYRNELTELESCARITQYLPLLASRRVRDLLRHPRDRDPGRG